MTRILVFGANGGTGREVTKQALEKGYHVTAIVRNPSNLTLSHPNLNVVKADVLDPASFERFISDHDAIISALGSTGTQPTVLYSKGLDHIIQAMEKHRVSRLICISAGGLYVHEGMSWLLKLATRLILQKILKHPYADMRVMEKEVMKSQFEWTIIRPPRLTNKPVTGKYRSAINADLKSGLSISRPDLVHFIVDHLFDKATYKGIVSIAY